MIFSVDELEIYLELVVLSHLLTLTGLTEECRSIPPTDFLLPFARAFCREGCSFFFCNCSCILQCQSHVFARYQ